VASCNGARGRPPGIKTAPDRGLTWARALHSFAQLRQNRQNQLLFEVPLNLSKARKDAPETIGDPVPPDIELHPLPPEVATKVSQARSHSFYIKEGNNAVVLVSPNDRRVADVIH
jgi:hypothetical protein